MNYKLLAIDIDDTLVEHAGRVSKANRDAISEASSSGIYVCLATGRGYRGSAQIRKQLRLENLIINYGGALIMDPKTDKPFFSTALDDEYIKEILGMAEELNVHCHIYQGDKIIYEKSCLYATIYAKKLHLPHSVDPYIRLRHWENVPKALIITTTEKAAELLPIFSKHFEGRVHVSASSPGFIEFNKIGANKGSALELLAKHLEIAQSDVAAIGDNTLDFEMIKWAGLGGAVENGNDKVKTIANCVVPSCSSNGVAFFIHNYILK